MVKLLYFEAGTARRGLAVEDFLESVIEEDLKGIDQIFYRRWQSGRLRWTNSLTPWLLLKS